MTALAALAAGLAAGFVVVALLWRHLVDTRAARQLEAWRAGGARSEVLRAVDTHRAGIKVQLGTELAPLVPAFPFEPADTRFLGNPAHFVVFAGHTAVKDRRQRELAEVVFVTLSSEQGWSGQGWSEQGWSTPGWSERAEGEDARLLDECVRAGRVRWLTLRVETPSSDGVTATSLKVPNPLGVVEAPKRGVRPGDAQR
ncbi:MAG: hypothetical protein FWC87_04100 [Acidimicrobiaceae bacterium]|nr:hypothetical protein [Acidimicrobiaceae bacterium]